MIILISSILYSVQIIVQHCNCINLIDLPQGRQVYNPKRKLEYRALKMYEPYPRKKGMESYLHRYWLGNDRPDDMINSKASRRKNDDGKDANIKKKIATLVEQTKHDTEFKLKEVEEIKQKYREDRSYRVGFVLSMVKKAREVLNELFNVAIKHRDEWQSLEQLKIFEMIVHTNVDTSHLLKQLTDLHASSDHSKTPDPTNTTKDTDINYESNIVNTESNVIGTESNKINTESYVIETESNVNEAESNVNEAESNINEAESNVNEAESNIINTESNIINTESNVLQTESKVKETESNINK